MTQQAAIMTNKQMLKLAAKASGFKRHRWHDGTFQIWHLYHYDYQWQNWDPIQCDGDAFRLAVRLRIDIRFTSKDVVCAFGIIGDMSNEYTGWDSDAATRLAITRAAAAIGAAMGDKE